MCHARASTGGVEGPHKAPHDETFGLPELPVGIRGVELSEEIGDLTEVANQIPCSDT